ncbi:MAG: hypothetical protein ABI222_17165 [Opitutaceae bacterium]
MSQTIVTPPLTQTLRSAATRMWGEPESRSVIIGVIGTILVHLLLLFIGPALLRSDHSHNPVRPAARPRQFSIQLSPDMVKPLPKPKSPMKFVETNPDAPDNAPDKTNNFAARNQQVAQEKPTPNGKSDRPAMEGQKEIHSTQIVTGQLSKPVEQTPVPPEPLSKPSESKVMAPKQEQVPLTGFEKKVGEDPTGFGTNVAALSEAAKNTPNRVEGMRDVPLVEGATDLQPAIDPHHPRPRLQVVKTMQTRPAIFEERTAGTQNVGLRGIDAKWSNYGTYLQKMVEIVQAQFDKLNYESRISPPVGTTVTVKFTLNSKGEVRITAVDASRGSDAAAKICTSSIGIPSPFGPWTDDMKAMLGEEQEMTYDFYYQ